MDFRDRHRFYVHWWNRRCREALGEGKTLYFAECPTSDANPREVDHLFSAVFKEGTRTFAFLSKQQRFVFTGMYASATNCKNPVNG